MTLTTQLAGGTNAPVMPSICIDLVSYDVTFEGEFTVVKDCAGSVLAQLGKPAQECWTKNCKAWIGGQWCTVEYDSEEQECAFRTHDFPAVAEWISDHCEAISSIGYEVLNHIQ